MERPRGLKLLPGLELPDSASQEPHAQFHDALPFLKRHVGIVWDPGQFARSLCGKSVGRFENPSFPPLLQIMIETFITIEGECLQQPLPSVATPRV